MESTEPGFGEKKSRFGSKNLIFIIIPAAIGLGLLIFGGRIGSAAKTDGETAEFSNYTSQLEDRVEALVRQVTGGEVSVLITLDCSEESVYAENISIEESSADGSNSSKKERDYLLLDSGDGLLLREICPRVRGVAVVCLGGDSASVQLKITEMLSVAFGIPKSKVSVCGSAW